jgi:sugar phosphate isomerase/epimerase
MASYFLSSARFDRRRFLRGISGSVAAGVLSSTQVAGAAAQVVPESIDRAGAGRPLTYKEKMVRIASNSYPIRWIFKANADVGDKDTVAQMKSKYGEITMLDFPDFTKKMFPGVYQMDLMSTLFGDMDDPSQFVKGGIDTFWGKPFPIVEFDPSSPSGKKWLETMANKLATTGTLCHHISNNAPRDISDLDPAKRKAGIEVAKKWLDGAQMLGAKSMRVNCGGPRIAPAPITGSRGYATNDLLEQYLTCCIESFKEMADYGAMRGVRLTMENHWGITADPINIRIIVEEVNHPFCEASPDFGNWEQKYHVYHGLNALAPYAHTTCHAKYWDRWEDIDVQRNVRIMLNNGFNGVFALEYEAGPWNGIEGAQHLFQEVLAAL